MSILLKLMVELFVMPHRTLKISLPLEKNIASCQKIGPKKNS